MWFGTYASPVETFVATADLKGKTIVTFCTFGSGGLNTSTDNLRKALPESTVVEGYGVRNARLEAAPTELELFLKRGHYIEGEAAPMPEYSEQTPVDVATAFIYDAACSNYPMLHAKPKTVGTAQTDEATYYLYTAEENEQTLQVKVQVGKTAGAVPEFTEVIR